MTIQKTSYKYQDGTLTVDFKAENAEDDWANDRDLRQAIDAVIKCAGSWKTFELYIKTNQYEDL